jgi:formamidopyrimidine-DNA glycosylase
MTEPPPKPCPTCGQPMTTIVVEGKPVEICTGCQGAPETFKP